MPNYDQDDDPDVIEAKAKASAIETQAEADAEVRVLEARKQLSPIAQSIYAVGDTLNKFTRTFGCMFILFCVVVGGIYLASQVFGFFFNLTAQ
jgi:hypothetical protein